MGDFHLDSHNWGDSTWDRAYIHQHHNLGEHSGKWRCPLLEWNASGMPVECQWNASEMAWNGSGMAVEWQWKPTKNFKKSYFISSNSKNNTFNLFGLIIKPLLNACRMPAKCLLKACQKPAKRL